MPSTANISMKAALQTRASLACQNCRRRKIRCDVASMVEGLQCTPCRQVDLSCAVDRGGDRRKTGSRKHVETLEQRILDLERVLQGHAKALPQGERIGTTVADTTLDDTTAPTVSTRSSPSVALPDSAESLVVPRSEPARRLTASNKSGTRSQSSNSIRDLYGNTARDTAYGEHELTTPFSTSAPMRSQPQLVQAYTEPHNHINLGPAVDSNTPQLKIWLLKSFFRYQPLGVNIVDEELFWEHRQSRAMSMWYSDFLENVMLACATRLSNSSAVRVLGEHFSSQAKVNICQALDYPSPASMQGFLLLSEYEVTQGRERTGWQLCGMACRLLPCVGLYRGTSEYPESEHMRQQRFRLQGACIALEGIWCLYVGCSTSIQRSVIQTVATSCQRQQGRDPATLSIWLGLCGPMADICDLLNSERPLTENAKTRLSRLNLSMSSWLETLPDSFTYNDVCIADLHPTAYEIQMQYNKLQILIHKAFGDGDGPHTTYNAVVYDAAIRIIRLLLIYRQFHESGKVRVRSYMLDAVNIALETLVEQYLRYPNLIQSHEGDLQWLRTAIASMIEIQPHFPVIGRTLNLLMVTVEGTLLAPLFRTPESFQASNWPPLESFAATTDQQSGVLETFDNHVLTTVDQFEPDDQLALDASLLSWPQPQFGMEWSLPTEQLSAV
ncbi:Nitrogen assimilation transcription factor nit-4 [Cyphellophora attinorum]|uniref:Nitrogen assimilation transcription factor nit-4 n=1 Tax=Cyphellophora attinorum TaxID=1664694 RepID=A0A0N1P0V0_9EURO|nr:Nitrogen assimilation transcription factor nit-4 [Phialophora attinorum]KPI39557.1 Nitrogen assimilation transcription factor nit-4 [Phialophora attinorum]